MSVQPRGAPDPWAPLRAALVAALDGHHRGLFAAELGISGVHLSRVLHGRNPSPAQLLAIAAALGLQISLHDGQGHILATAEPVPRAS